MLACARRQSDCERPPQTTMDLREIRVVLALVLHLSLAGSSGEPLQLALPILNRPPCGIIPL